MSLSEQRRAGEERELGWAKAGRRFNHQQVEESRGSGEQLPAGLPRPSAAGKFVRARGPALVNPTGPPVFVLGDLAPRLSLPKTS